MYIGICDDDPKIREQLCTLIKKQNVTDLIEIKEFATIEQLLENRGKLDVLFLDIEVGDENSLKILSQHKNIQHLYSIIVLVSAHSCYITVAYNLSIFQYLLKPIKEELFNQVFLQCYKHYQRLNQYCKLYTANGLEKYIPIQEVVYITKANRQIVFYDLELQVYYSTESSLANVIKKISQFGFCQTHKSYIVNLAYVKKIVGNEVELCVNGNTLLLSVGKIFKNSVQQYYLQYLEMRRG